MSESPDENILQQLKSLRRKGRYLEAWDLIKNLAPPEEWPTAEGRLAGALLIERLGANSRATRIYFREWRRKSSRSLARSEMFWEVLSKRGAFLTWLWLNRYAPEADEHPEQLADHQARLAVVLMNMRDFDRAEACLQKAKELNPDSAWFDLLSADILLRQDRREESLDKTSKIRQAEPDYISAIRMESDLLSELGRDDESVAVLRAGLSIVQAGQLVVPLVNLLIELGHHDEAIEALDLYEKLTPLAEDNHLDWMYGRRCDIASAREDITTALMWAEKIKGSGFYKKVAEKLRGAHGSLKRHLLEVPFVRQHHSTCAPASVTSIALYWGREVGHLELANEICYDGTPDYKERAWAERNGWATREFKVTLDSAKQLLDQGMPFVLNTVYPGGAHAQVVTGYDEFRMVFFVRDPGNRHTTEFLAAESLEEQAPFGPRGFVMVPVADAARLQSQVLPDSSLYDLSHQINTALDAHDRPLALLALDALRVNHSDHLLRWHGELTIARYDGLQSQVLGALEEILKQHPKVENWQTERLGMIREIHGREAMIAALREVCEGKASHPIHWRMLARELHWDDRHAAEALRLLKRVDRSRLDSLSILTSANVIWWEQHYEKAVGWYRLAACLDSRNEGLVMSYFNATKWVRQTEDALAMMRHRFEMEGDRSGQPAITLYRALDQVQKPVEGLAVLEESLRRRPDDTEQALFVAGEMILWNRVARAREILEGIRANARSAEWHRVQARLASYEGDGEAQMRHYRAVLEDQPLDVPAHRSIAFLLDMQVGEKAGYAFLQEACARFPFHWHLHLALFEWAKGLGTEVRETAVQELLRIDPSDGWARRELAELRRRQQRFAEAHAELDHADALDGGDVAQHTMRASIMEDEGRAEEAREECRKALKLEIDNGFAIRCLMRLSRTREQRLEALDFMLAELKRQTTQGNAVGEFYSVAKATLDDAALEQVLREAWQQRPDLWQTGVNLAEHLRNTEQLQEAAEIMRSLTERFPLMPRVWMELGLCLEKAGDRPAAIQAALKVREINPAWSWGMRTLSEMMRKTGDYTGARAIAEEVLRHCPEDALCHGLLAEILWHDGEKEAAIKHLSTAVERDPDYNWAWDMLASWGKSVGRPEAARDAARRLQRERPAESRTWMIYADLLSEPHELEECLTMFDKAIELSPRFFRPADMKARVLALAGRFEAALAVCREHPSRALELRHREGWILNWMGKYQEAVKVLDAALEEDPSYPWPWQMLTDWHKQNDHLELAEKACRQYARLQPTEPVPLGYLGSILEARMNFSEAKSAYRQAREVGPDYPFAFHRLLFLLLKDSEWTEAAALLEQAAHHFPALNIQSRWFIYYKHRRQWGDAKSALGKMLRDPEDDSAAFTRVLEVMENIPSTELLTMRQEVEAILAEGQCNVSSGQLYVEMCKLADRLPAMEVMKRIPVNSEQGERAFKTYIYWIADRWKTSRREAFRLWGLKERMRWNQLMKQHQGSFRQNAELYGAVSYTLNEMQPPEATVAWLHDWRERRQEMEPYILNNLVLALQRTGKAQEASEAVKFGMTLAQNNPIKMRFHIWAAIDSLLEEDVDRATQQMDAVIPNELEGYGKDLLKMMETILSYFRETPPAFSEIQLQLVEFSGAHRNNPVMQAVIRRTCGLAGKKLRRIYPSCWYRLHRFFQSLGMC